MIIRITPRKKKRFRRTAEEIEKGNAFVKLKNVKNVMDLRDLYSNT